MKSSPLKDKSGQLATHKLLGLRISLSDKAILPVTEMTDTAEEVRLLFFGTFFHENTVKTN